MSDTATAVAFVGVVLYLLAAVVLRRWLVLLLPAVLIPLSYYGPHVGWWGHGVGDVDWWVWPAILTVPFVAFTAALIGTAKLATRFENGTKVVNLTVGVTAAAATVIIVLTRAG